MIILNDLEQGSEAWLQARAGIPTASNFDKLITATGKRSASLEGYARTMASERWSGKREETFQSQWMARGNEVEPQARAWYEFETGHDVAQVGFVLSDDRGYGCSPDGLMPARGLELKCPKPETHIGYLMDNKLPTTYIQQVQGCMFVCECDSWDFVSFHPDFPPLILTVRRDEVFIKTLASLIQEVRDTTAEIILQLERMQK